MLQEKKTIADLSDHPLCSVFEFLTQKDLFNVILSSKFFNNSIKKYHAFLFHKYGWKALAQKDYDEDFTQDRMFEDIISRRYGKVSGSFSFDPLEPEGFKSEYITDEKVFARKGIRKLCFTYEHSVPAQTPSGFGLSYSGKLYLFQLEKVLMDSSTISPVWQLSGEIEDPYFSDISCARSLCGLTFDGKIFCIKRNSTGFSDPLKVPISKAKCINSTYLHHYTVTTENEVFYWSIDDLVVKKVDCPKEPIAQISCEAYSLYILYSNSEVYIVEDKEVEADTKIASLCKELSKLGLNSISSGIAHSIGAKQERISPMESWNTETVVTWMDKINFEDYTNVIKFKKFTGKEIIEGDREFFEDVLGLTDENLLQKFCVERGKYQTATLGKTLLYGWGVNHHGQLASKANSCKPANPITIQLPDLGTDHIKEIFCGVKTSAFVTIKGQLWMTGNVKEYKRPKPPKPETKKKDKTKHQKKAPSKKDKILREEEKDKLEQYNDRLEIEKSLSHRWVNIDRVLSPELVAHAIGVVMTQRENIIYYTIRNQRRDGKQPGKKFLGAEKILKQIEWDSRLKSSKFVIGYEDRFLGNLEMEYADFVESEIPYHRVQYIKKESEIVWDRKARIQKLIQ